LVRTFGFQSSFCQTLWIEIEVVHELTLVPECKTPPVSFKRTVKEQFNIDDYRFNIKGFFDR
jgi:hypothetical protein